MKRFHSESILKRLSDKRSNTCKGCLFAVTQEGGDIPKRKART